MASSGLGHVPRGVESWANDLAVALHRSGADVTLFQGAPKGTEPWRRVLACCRRYEPVAQRLHAVTKHLGGWRYYCGSTYDIEQTTFALSLWRQVRKDYDILHVQDPMVGVHLHNLHRKGWSRPRVILANGTDEDDSVLRKVSNLQHLAPTYLTAWESRKPLTQVSVAIPNFIDTTLFQPGDRRAARAVWNIPQDALVVLSVAALTVSRKRCDYLIREFAEFRRAYSGPAYLVLAGAREVDTPAVVALGRDLLGDSVLILESVDRTKLPSLYQAADIFALASLREVLGIVILEGLASGLPVALHRTPVMEYVAGDAGQLEDASIPGGLVRQWIRLSDAQVRADMSAGALRHVQRTFSEAVVLRQIEELYDVVMTKP